MTRLLVYCVDIGSVKSDRFGWARLDPSTHELRKGGDIAELASKVADDLKADHPVALGFECPLFVPVPQEAQELGSARPGEGNRAWSAGAGAGSLAIGLAEVPWILQTAADEVTNRRAYLDWESFGCQAGALFVWEAFVTAQAKGMTHQDDAVIGARAFAAALPDPTEHDALAPSERVFSLIGAALLRTGWTTDTGILSSPAVVIKAIAPEPERVEAE